MSTVSLQRLTLHAWNAVSLPGRILTWMAVRRSRIALDHLDARLLDDIGISSAQAKAETQRPFWDF
ncbi:DUF1127 domain-containing protein [Paenirhodobacter populi]|uniref:DUF1127 domain-containing protein n=1 Tax=Paenirhodobacter populi TaxID=2306993 RepID=UPI001F4F3832|nr:DUF1127 domain-containing protein [Sinirhodobacter populi]